MFIKVTCGIKGDPILIRTDRITRVTVEESHLGKRTRITVLPDESGYSSISVLESVDDVYRLLKGMSSPSSISDIDSNIVTPSMEVKDSNRIDYVCSNCECSLINSSGFYLYCPRCGDRIDYSNHSFLMEGLNAIR